MQSKEKNDIIFIRLFPDEDLHNKLKEACKLYNVKTVIVLSGIGQLKNFRLGYFKEKNNYVPEKFNDPHELISLSGTICQYNEDYEIHLHAVLSNEKKKAIGGHLIEGKVEVTNEIVLLNCAINTFTFFKKEMMNKSL